MNYSRNADKIIDVFMEVSRVIMGLVDSVFDLTLIGVISKMAPAIAPAPAAYSVYRALVAIQTEQWVAIAVAISIEAIGMFQSKTALRARNWNIIKLKSDPAAPFNLALAMAIIYFVTAFGLTSIIEFKPEWAKVVYPTFVVFAASVYVSTAIATDLTRWEVDRADRMRQQAERSGLKSEIRRLTDQANKLGDKVKRLASEAKRLDNEAATKQRQLAAMGGQFAEKKNGFVAGNRAALGQANESRQEIMTRRRARLADLLRGNPDLTNGQLAKLLDVSVTTVKSDKATLNGQLIKGGNK